LTAETSEAKRVLSELVGGRIDIVPRPDGGLDAVLHGDYMAAFRIAAKGCRAGELSKELNAEGAALNPIAWGHAGPTASHVW
jgi:hypothetical protein